VKKRFLLMLRNVLRRVALIALMLLPVDSLVQANPATARSAVTRENKLGLTFDVTYMSKWLSKGAEAYGQQGALFETIDIDFYGTGFGVNVTHRSATSSGYVDKERFDYRPYYKGRIFENKTYTTNFNISAGYEHYPGLARNVANTTWEWIFAFSWPNVLPKGFVPGYIVHYEYPAGSGYRHSNNLNTQQLPLPLKLSSEVAYTDGLGGAAHDWSYATFGISTQLKICENLTFVPGVYQQITMDDSISKRKDITYCVLSMKYKF
jgi:hypothetical protein